MQICAVATSRERKLDDNLKDYKSTTEGPSRLTNIEAEAAVNKPPKRGRGISTEDWEGLKAEFAMPIRTSIQALLEQQGKLQPRSMML